MVTATGLDGSFQDEIDADADRILGRFTFIMPRCFAKRTVITAKSGQF
jgi:hypothetical protein